MTARCIIIIIIIIIAQLPYPKFDGLPFTNRITLIVWLNVLWTAVRVWNEDADVDAEYWEDDTEQRDRRELADELDADEDTDEHEEQQDAAVHSVAVVRVRRDVDRAEQRQGWRCHVLLSHTAHQPRPATFIVMWPQGAAHKPQTPA